MHAAEIVIGVVDRNHVAMVLIALGERIRQPGLAFGQLFAGQDLEHIRKKMTRPGPTCSRRPALSGLDNSGLALR